MIQREPIVLKAETKAVRALDLAQIDGGEVLVVAELERAAGAWIAEVSNPRDEHRGNPLVVFTVAVRTGNFEHVQSKIAILRVAVGAHVLPRITGVAVQKERGRNRIGETRGRRLHPASGVSGIAAVESI